MKKIIRSFIPIFLVFLVVWSCSSDKKENTTALTQAQMDEISNSYEQIAEISNNLLTSDNSFKTLGNYLDTFKNLPGVENAWMKDSSLYVKFENGGIIEWFKTSDFVIPPYGKNIQLEFNLSRQPVGNKKTCLINQQFNDEDRQYCRDIINDLQTSFETANYDVTVVNGNDVDLDFIENEIKNYGAIFYISHGFFDGTRTWICTGQEPKDPDNILEELFNELYLWWVEGKISIGTCSEKRNGQNKSISFYSFSDKFVENTYSSNSFPNSLIYLVACQSFKETNQLGKAFNNKGAGVTIGWNETNCLGQATGKLLMELMLGGATVEEAFEALPKASKTDHCAVSTGAELTYYPSAGKDICLVEDNDITITINSPVNGNIYTGRVLTLSGQVTGAENIIRGIVEVNGIPTTLTFIGTDFEQPIIINNGLNTIKVICLAELSNGQSVYGIKEITVNGNIPSLNLFTELRWNTNYSDVDFHLLPPGADMSSLWTSTDCYYYNNVTNWGGYLDVDDVDGYGPEHITMPQYYLSGQYRLFVHYYDSHGAGTTSAFVSVSVNNGAIQDFGPYTLSNYGYDGGGDIYEVCTIEYPGGIITPVNKYYFLGKGKGNTGLEKMSKK